MKKSSVYTKAGRALVKIFQIIFLIAGGFLLVKNKQKVFAFLKNQNFIISLVYVIIVGFLALLYRLIMILNWILQQAR